MRRTTVLLTTMALTLLVASGVALAAAIGSAGAQSSVVGPGESIQKAIDAADPGDTIVVRGVHREDVVIRKNGIKLRGVGNAVIEVPTRAKADSPCSKAFGPGAFCVLGDVNVRPRRLDRHFSQNYRPFSASRHSSAAQSFSFLRRFAREAGGFLGS
jgi:hypothetical protein